MQSPGTEFQLYLRVEVNDYVNHLYIFSAQGLVAFCVYLSTWQLRSLPFHTAIILVLRLTNRVRPCIRLPDVPSDTSCSIFDKFVTFL